MKRISASIIILAATATPAHAEFLPAPELVDSVLSASPAVQAGAARIDEAQGEARRLSAGPYEWRISTSHLQRDVRHVGNFQEYETSLTRGFRLPGKAGLDRKIGALGVTAAEQSAEDARHQAALLLLDHWMTWLLESEKTAIAAAQVAAWDETLRIVQRRIELGQTPTIEGELTRSSRAEAETARILADGAEKSARARLQTLFPALTLPAQAPLVDAPTTLDAPQYEERVIAASHEIGYWQSEYDRLMLQARRARADRVADPELGLRALSERNGEETAMGFTLSVPLGGRARGGVAQKNDAAARAARFELERVRMEIHEAARTNIISVETALAAWRSAQAALIDSQRAIERLRRGFAQQVTGLTDLQAAERRHAEIRLMEAEARGRANRARLKALVDAHDLWID